MGANAWLREGPPLVIAHRGANAYAPENTLAAFRLAGDQGADAIEFDVRATADGHLVVIHDASLARTTDGEGEIGALTLAEVRRADAAGRGPPAGRGRAAHGPSRRSAGPMPGDGAGLRSWASAFPRSTRSCAPPEGGCSWTSNSKSPASRPRSSS